MSACMHALGDLPLPAHARIYKPNKEKQEDVESSHSLPVDDAEVARVLKRVHQVGHCKEDAAQRLWKQKERGVFVCLFVNFIFSMHMSPSPPHSPGVPFFSHTLTPGGELNERRHVNSLTFKPIQFNSRQGKATPRQGQGQGEEARTQMSTFSSSCRFMYRSTISGARYICACGGLDFVGYFFFFFIGGVVRVRVSSNSHTIPPSLTLPPHPQPPQNISTNHSHHLRGILGHPLLLLRALPRVRQGHRPALHTRAKVDQPVAPPTTTITTIIVVVVIVIGGDEQHILQFQVPMLDGVRRVVVQRGHGAVGWGVHTCMLCVCVCVWSLPCERQLLPASVQSNPLPPNPNTHTHTTYTHTHTHTLTHTHTPHTHTGRRNAPPHVLRHPQNLCPREPQGLPTATATTRRRTRPHNVKEAAPLAVLHQNERLHLFFVCVCRRICGGRVVRGEGMEIDSAGFIEVGTQGCDMYTYTPLCGTEQTYILHHHPTTPQQPPIVNPGPGSCACSPCGGWRRCSGRSAGRAGGGAAAESPSPPTAAPARPVCSWVWFRFVMMIRCYWCGREERFLIETDGLRSISIESLILTAPIVLSSIIDQVTARPIYKNRQHTTDYTHTHPHTWIRIFLRT
jgi:hypothetical protein